MRWICLVFCLLVACGNPPPGGGSVEDAIAAATKAINLNPKDVDAYIDRGEARMRKGDWEGARADFTTAIELAASGCGAEPGVSTCL